MKLSELFRSVTTSRTDENGESGVVSQKNLNTLNLNRQIKALAPGQTLHGEVISKNGGEVQIKLADDMVLSARLEREMAIDIGKIMTFEVRNNGKALTLSPLFANTATDANVLKALDMASLPVNGSSVEMTQTMMEQGMSIDKNSIQNVYRDVTANMDAAVRDIVQLHKLGIEVTPETINSLKQYQSMEYQLVGGMEQIANELSTQMESILQSGEIKEALVFFSKMYAVFSEQLSDADKQVENSGIIKEQPVINAEMLPEAIRTENPSIVLSNGTKNVNNAEGQLFITLPAQEEMQVLKEGLKQLDPEGTNPKVQQLMQALDRGTVTAFDVKEAVSTKDFAKIIKNQMMENWLLKPEQVQHKEEVERVYQRISRQLGEMQKVLSETTGLEQGSNMKSVSNMQSNIDFMNQLNQTFTYIQLPLQMSGKETHGELYIYTNKKNLARADGNVSAFLHLDMENLGPVDVYVAMQNQKVNTKFYLKDDEMIDFIQAHIHLLNERLAKRGYSMNCEMLLKENDEQDKTILERITESEKNVTVLSQYAFDVRA